MSLGTLITVAPTGAETRKQDAPALPVTLDELLHTAKECAALGAAMIHVHVRDDAGEPTLDPGRLRETVAALRAETDLIVQLSTGGAVGDPEEARRAVLDAGPDAASLTMGSVNFGDGVFLNRWPFVVDLHRRMRDRGIVPEYEIFDLGQLHALRRLLAEDGLPAGGHVHLDLVMGVPGGMDGTTETVAACLAAMRDLPDDLTFSATGIGRTTIPVMLAALSAGGHLRVGMEDTLTYAKHRPVESNMQLVARAVGLAQLAQRPPLTPAQARELLGLTA
ncbi:MULTISPECIES: beta-keto acid cleavage family enzyme [Catenuloplanes]|uniref:Uncharacterized protein (DUF849 family) n=1 Tax=Catenuloplanes niger TaxID=587534 RepID=A0AAE4CWN9_9ACTN|nr:3-keto-5-aminohexanoate cleavage protein [Catenuloplanes niger]MDR7323969.1 uncharacterized protein (DUF849 family) [Catenuloplanes niger]